MEPENSLPHTQQVVECPILNRINSVHTSTSDFLNTHFNIILTSTRSSPKWFTHDTSSDKSIVNICLKYLGKELIE